MIINLAVRHGSNIWPQIAFAFGAIGAVLALIVIIGTFMRSRRRNKK